MIACKLSNKHKSAVSRVSHRSMLFLENSIFGIALVLVFLLFPSSGNGQSIEAYLSEDSVRVGDRLFLTLVATHGSESTPMFPPVEAGEEFFGDLEVLSISGSGFRDNSESAYGSRVDSLVYEVTTFALDTAYVPSIPVFFVQGQDTAFYASRPLELPIISLVTPDAENIRDLIPIVEFPRNVWPWILGLLLLAACIVGLIVYLGKRKTAVEEVAVRAPTPVIPPYEEAVRKLRGLEKKINLNDLHQIKPYYVELTEALRVYLGRRLKMSAMESTSEELIRDLKRLSRNTKLPGESVDLIHRVLRVSDLVKFADLRPRPEVGQQAMNETRKALDVVEASFKLSAQEQQSQEADMQAVKNLEDVPHE